MPGPQMGGGIGAGGHNLFNPPGMGNGLMPGSNNGNLVGPNSNIFNGG